MPGRIAVAFMVLISISSLGACTRLRSREQNAQRPWAAPSANLARGKIVYAAQCAVCHGAGGMGGPIGPSLRAERGRRGLAAVTAIVKDPFPPMPKLYPAQINLQEVRDVAAFVESL